MTVPVLFGWETVVTIVVIVMAVGVAFLLISAARTSGGGRSEWQAYLESRSKKDPGPVTDHEDAPA